MLRYAITDRHLFHGSEAEQRAAVVEQACQAARADMDFVQLREKDLEAEDLLSLARDLRSALPPNTLPRLLINGSVGVAMAARADGLHLPGGWTAEHLYVARTAFVAADLPRATLSVAAHSLAEVRAASDAGADLILFGPVFEKRVGQELVRLGLGVEALEEAVRVAGATPVLALGGVTAANTSLCRDAGAAGVAAIRLFLRPVPAPMRPVV